MSDDILRVLGQIARDQLDGQAFERARNEFGREYASALRSASRQVTWEQAHDEAMTEALQAFLKTYAEAAAR